MSLVQSNGDWLTTIDEAQRVLAQIERVADAAELVDAAETAKVYARNVLRSQEAQNHAAHVSLLCQRRAGQLLATAEKKTNQWSAGDTLSQALGVKSETQARQQSSRWQRLAEIDQAEFDEAVDHLKENELTTAGVLARVNRANRRRVDRDARTVTTGAARRVNGDGWTMVSGDMTEVLAAMPAGSVDMIVTDPPYPNESLHLWTALAAGAAHVLVSQGVLAALAGKIGLGDRMWGLGEHLKYGWTYCQPLPGANSRILARQVLQSWKPWLAYSNGPWPSGRVDWHPDLLGAKPRAKTRYAWEQSTGAAVELIEVLCPTGGLVLDPFAGVGTYGVAALEAGRPFIGVEADAGRFEQAVERLRGVS